MLAKIEYESVDTEPEFKALVAKDIENILEIEREHLEADL